MSVMEILLRNQAFSDGYMAQQRRRTSLRRQKALSDLRSSEPSTRLPRPLGGFRNDGLRQSQSEPQGFPSLQLCLSDSSIASDLSSEPELTSPTATHCLPFRKLYRRRRPVSSSNMPACNNTSGGHTGLRRMSSGTLATLSALAILVPAESKLGSQARTEVEQDYRC